MGRRVLGRSDFQRAGSVGLPALVVASVVSAFLSVELVSELLLFEVCSTSN